MVLGVVTQMRDLKTNCNLEDYDFAVRYKSKEFITHAHTSVAHFAI